MKVLQGRLAGAGTNPSPRIDCYPAEKPLPARPGVLIFPGGGYGGLADYEGEGYARYLASHGISSFVVMYRLGSQGFRHPAMLEDALSAVAAVRGEAAELGVNPHLVGVMGSSAGGHLAAHAMVAFDRHASPVSLRPDFGVLCYPVITMEGEHAEPGSRRQLLGDSPSPALLHETSVERHVSARTPPCFLFHTREDRTVPFQNSTRFADALHAHGVPFELHVFDRGPHGLGSNLSHPWAGACVHWIAGLAPNSA